MKGLWIVEWPMAQTVAGGETVEHWECVMGAATYEISRVYGGDCTREELLQACIAKARLEQDAFDVTVPKEYNRSRGSVRRRREA